MSHWMLEKLSTVKNDLSISDFSGDYSYNDLLGEIQGLQKAWQRIPSGSTVAINADYSFHSIALLLAMAFKKCIVVPIVTDNIAFIDAKVEESFSEYVFSRNNAKWQIQHVRQNSSHPHIDALRQISRAGLVLFSSGSTGKPKAMIHDFDQLIDSYKDRKIKNISFLIFLMFDHIGGMNTLLNALSMGAHLVIPQKRETRHICELIEKYNVRVLPASPSFLNLLLISEDYKYHDISSLRLVTYGTESMPEPLLTKLAKTFPRVRFVQTFGTSETGIAKTSSRSSDSTYFRIDDQGVEYKIVHGELFLKTGTQVLGYLNAPTDSFADGWFQTGDLVEQSDDGYLRIVGRTKEMINVGGEKVLPSEVENVLRELEEIADCLVYGQNNAITGQHVAADIVLNVHDDPKKMRNKIRAYCKKILSSYKVPAKIYFVESLPLSESFKKKRKI